MISNENVLNCANCEHATASGDMCPVVALRSVARLSKIGYDTSSDSARPAAIIDRLLANPSVRDIAEEECRVKLGRATLVANFGIYIE